MQHSACLWLAVAVLAYSAPCTAQQDAGANERIALQSRAARAESAASLDSVAAFSRAKRLFEANAVRARLRDGDFHPGDRITLWVNGEPTMSSTFTVRAGNVLVIPTLPDISLRGVLRSELHAVLLREISRYIREPEIQVTTLVNIAVLGAVGRPGFYAVPPDAPITDVLMTAGGPGANSDFGRSRITRAGAELADAPKVRRWLEDNSTLDDMGIQSGDQIIVGERTHRWQAISAVLGVTSLLATSLVLVRH
jgi:protein involved in polysaccharide export with SLBB domain